MAQLTGSGLGNGTNYAMVDNSLGTNDGRLWVDSTISGVPMVAISGGIHIGSVSANVDSVYVTSGTMYIASGNVSLTGSIETFGAYTGSHVYQGTTPWNINGNVSTIPSGNAPYSGKNYETEIIYIGSEIGSIVKHFSTGSYVQVLTYDIGSSIINIGSWV